MENGIAAKAFIVNDDREVLLIKRRPDDPHRPEEWEVPGGRLDPGEHIFDGLKRETKEEAGLDISIQSPLREHKFTRDDSQMIRMLTFLCMLHESGQPVRLSEEHTEHAWLGLEEAKKRIAEEFHEEIDVLKRNLSP